MALTESNIPVSRHDYFIYYGSGGGAGTTLDEELAPETAFELDSIRLHLSVAHVSVEYLRIWVSSVFGSAHNLILLSLAISGVQDVLWVSNRTLVCQYGDKICASLCLSSANIYGIAMTGWSITG